MELASSVITNGMQIFPEILAGIRGYCERKHILQLHELIGKAADCSLAYNKIPAKATTASPGIAEFQLLASRNSCRVRNVNLERD